MQAKSLLFMLSLVSCSLLAKANGDNGDRKGKSESIIQGSVTDATTKKPLQGVTVSITSAKSQEKRTLTTDACGSFKTSVFPPGEFIILLEKKGFKPYRKEGVVIKEGTQAKLNFDISPEAEEATVDVLHPLIRMIDDWM